MQDIDDFYDQVNMHMLKRFLIGSCLQQQLQGKKWLLARMHFNYVYHVVRQNILHMGYTRQCVKSVLDSFMLGLHKHTEVTEDEIEHIAGECVVCASDVSVHELHPWCKTCSINQPVHTHCLSEWLCYKHTCPTCRNPLHMIGFHPIDPDVVYLDVYDNMDDEDEDEDDEDYEEETEEEETEEEGEEDEEEEEEEDDGDMEIVAINVGRATADSDQVVIEILDDGDDDQPPRRRRFRIY